MLQLVSLLITFTFCQQRIPAQEAGGGRAVRQGPEHISLLHLVVLPSVKEKLILTVWNLLIQAVCQRPRLHLVPPPSIYRGCFSKHCLKAVFAPELILCGIIEDFLKIPDINADIAKIYGFLKTNYWLLYWQSSADRESWTEDLSVPFAKYSKRQRGDRKRVITVLVLSKTWTFQRVPNRSPVTSKKEDLFLLQLWEQGEVRRECMCHGGQTLAGTSSVARCSQAPVYLPPCPPKP